MDLFGITLDNGGWHSDHYCYLCPRGKCF